jgi:glutathione S-transferase
MSIDYKLYQFVLCPFSRKVRIFLAEKNLQVDFVNENFWEKRNNFIALNPTGHVPVLLNYEDNSVIAESSIICEYLEEKHGGIKLIGDDPASRAEVRRITAWFDHKFFEEVGRYVLYEKIIKYYKNEGSPNPLYLRASNMNLDTHFQYMEYLLTSRKWLAGNKISLADLTAAAHLSILDYLGHINWKHHPQIKEWYLLVKSRPSFNSILNDCVVGFEPSRHYTDLDF